MQKLLLLFCFLCTLPLGAQIVTTDPAAPTDDQSVTITFDATQGTGGLADCNCDVYVHTGVITDAGEGWRYVATEWGVANPDWRMTPVAGEPNKYTYTYSPTIREYYGVPSSEAIEQISLVFRNADGSMEGKASGNQDIFVDVSQGGNVLGITATGDPEQQLWALGKPLPVQLGSTVAATLEVFDNGMLVQTTTGTSLSTDVILTSAGDHTIRFVATTSDGQVQEDEFTVTARLETMFTEPSSALVSAQGGDIVNLKGTSFIEARHQVFIDGTSSSLGISTEPSFDINAMIPAGLDVYTFRLETTYQGDTATDYVTFVLGDQTVADPPAGLQPGLTTMDDGSIMILLRAPGKNDVFIQHNFNNFAPTATTRMTKSIDGGTFWVELDDLPEEGDLLYQFLIDGDILQPDPFSKLILDPFNDPFISEETFAGIPPYPTAATSGILTWHRRQRPDYEWQSSADYERPDPDRMVVYEILIRDFLEDHSYTSLTDTLDYLERLGINVIELMPINEFEGNLSWGYNPSFHGALDKYYGSPEDLKAFVDACHQRGIAVVADIVYNHAFGQNPFERMWWDPSMNRPAADNPYFNVTPKDPLSFGSDFNHESPLTKEYVKVTTEYWLREFRLDGFRWDLSKGFTQRETTSFDAWAAYDPGRIAILKDYADHVWDVDPQAIMIMEHFAAQREEEELGQYGNSMYFWAGAGTHNNYLEGSMGYNEGGKSDLGSVLARNRGFSGLNLVGYMESHDEERMQTKNERFGNRMGDYDVRELATGLDRIELASTFFYTLPGPKMLWQFGELGYDFGLRECPNGQDSEDCKLDNKPILWEYREEPDRQDVYNWIADLNYLRNNFDFFHGEIVTSNFRGDVKSANLRGNDGEVVLLGNFGVTEVTVNNVFPSAGDWYDYGKDAFVAASGPSTSITLAPGEYHLFLDREITPGGQELETSVNDQSIARLKLEVSPNPTAGEMAISFSLAQPSHLTVELVDLNGRTIQQLFSGRSAAGERSLRLMANDVPSGMYFLRVTDGVGAAVRKVIIQ
ncbi:alpha-amylase family glycosyl hydrolase [Lewinella sp. 4G2]|uniref:DUF4961 domain-containing protein n=1 Tax=Lewinella sp. 4G2 TaxID=1803372 RepID=UPI0007B4AE97|nr:alpha-amylase family glycosyl hydrolase [Lewinella sp. 4G2]OAV44654.1 hypothetical protein A3850_009190 [Lewinella sp. 4G2]